MVFGAHAPNITVDTHVTICDYCAVEPINFKGMDFSWTIGVLSKMVSNYWGWKGCIFKCRGLQKKFQVYNQPQPPSVILMWWLVL